MPGWNRVRISLISLPGKQTCHDPGIASLYRHKHRDRGLSMNLDKLHQGLSHWNWQARSTQVKLNDE